MDVKITPQARYDAVNTTQIKLKLNRKTDADILNKLASVDNRQGYIKSLIRADLTAGQASPSFAAPSDTETR